MIVDLHTHTIASGHGTRDTIADMAKAAAARGMAVLGITDHGPATCGAASASYFMNLGSAPRERCGVAVLYGAEVSILEGGALDLPDSVLARLDYVIASMHMPPRRRSRGSLTSGTAESNTADYLKAMENPFVRVIGHCDNSQFPADYERIVSAAAKNGVIMEINNASLIPGGWHQIPGISNEDNYRRLLALCREQRVKILISSDSHGNRHIGEAPLAEALVRELQYPEELIVNRHPEMVLNGA
ncbi:PHP domain-containing protein [Lachnoclostridium sp. Marseille-P6806]|uniref:PHP domain-containing protein n=1 Tax=Lachnoclostridium sp. Marseille-P6806 TaxID=2364793 RepID=UPI001F5E5893|nr:PHP domain-containing protein [Lachnoclostridium sp. Marseille-P6806]